MDRQSILYRTLWLFGIAFLAALLVIAGLIWLTMRRAPRRSWVFFSPSLSVNRVAPVRGLLEVRRVEPFALLDVVHGDDEVVAGRQAAQAEGAGGVGARRRDAARLRAPVLLIGRERDHGDGASPARRSRRARCR